MPELDVCVVGEINLDLIFYGLSKELILDCELLVSGLALTLGSASAIFAHNLAMLGTKAGFISKTGTEALRDRNALTNFMHQQCSGTPPGGARCPIQNKELYPEKRLGQPPKSYGCELTSSSRWSLNSAGSFATPLAAASTVPRSLASL